MALPPGYAIRPAAGEDVARLPGIELRAAALFEGQGLPESVMNEHTGLEDFEAARREGRLFVAVCDDAPVGFALAEELEAGVHLEELDVDPDHGRRGLGAALVEAVCDWARGRGFHSVSLTTFRDLPWNAPFYARLGFEELAGDGVDEELREILAEEAEGGLDPARRVAMRRRL